MISIRNVGSWFSLADKKVWQKLALIGAPFLLPIAILSYFVLMDSLETMDIATREKNGLEYIRATRFLREHLQQHRGLANGYLSGDDSLKAEVLDRQALVDKDIQAVDAADLKYGAGFRVTENWNKAKADWQTLKSRVMQLKPPESFAQHTKLIADISVVALDVGEFSTLILDPDTDSYFLQDIVVHSLPTTAEYLAQSRGLGTGIAARKKITPEERTTLAVLLAQMKSERAAVNHNLASAFRNNPSLHAPLDGPAQTYLNASDAYTEYLSDKLIKPEVIEVVPKDLFDTATRSIDANFALFDKINPSLVALLDARIARSRTKLIVSLAGILGGLAFVSFISYLVTRSITTQVQSIMSMFGQIGMGNFAARTLVASQDELGEMATSLNAMLDNTLALMQSSEEKEQIQQSIGRLLEEVSGVADGDLTKDAEVTTDMTGAIADSFNYMIEQLRKIIGNVQDATLQVSSSANEIHATTEHLAQGSEAQAEQIVNTSAAIDEMAVSIQQVSENAALSATVAQQSLANAKTGNDAVQNTIQGMNRIRDQVQETAKRIKRLGESSQEIGQIIQLIDDIADRTSILALNASIQAAMAGEAGRGFAVVAEEVERLAIRSTDATKKIATLVKTIQSETNEAVGAMEKGIQEVVEGSKLAGEAGHALGEIQGVSNRLAELIQSISLASKQQARGSEALAKSMGEISQITQQTAAGTKQAAESVNELAGLADGLRSSVSTFRLPSTNGNGHGHAPAKPVESKGKGKGKDKDDKSEKRRRELART
jgi:twitching motility protein PilJ